MRPGLQAEVTASLRNGLPAALLLALSIGLVVAVGANLSNAFPSAERPFGWPGPANFENGVAMVRPELVLAASLPALLLGVRALPASRAGQKPIRPLGAILGSSALVGGAVLASTLIGAGVARQSPADAYLAFWVAHFLLAMACFSLGFLAHAATRNHAPLAALGAWGGFAFLMDNTVRWRLFRTSGYDQLASGALPTWFYAMQALSPISAYRATLILWRPGFRDYLEHAALDGAAMPTWLSASTLALVMLLLWVVLPLSAACALLALRARRDSGPTGRPAGKPSSPSSAASTVARQAPLLTPATAAASAMGMAPRIQAGAASSTVAPAGDGPGKLEAAAQPKSASPQAHAPRIGASLRPARQRR